MLGLGMLHRSVLEGPESFQFSLRRQLFLEKTNARGRQMGLHGSSGENVFYYIRLNVFTFSPRGV